MFANAVNHTESIAFNLSESSSTDVFTKTESMPPYALYGDRNNGTDFLGKIFNSGSYTITATPYSENSAKGFKGQDYVVNFSMTDNAQARSSRLSNSRLEMDEIPAAQTFKVYPNPILGKEITLEFSKPIQGKFRYTLVDALNRVLYEGEGTFSKPSTKMRLDFSDLRLQQGTYYLRVLGENESYFGIRLQK